MVRDRVSATTEEIERGRQERRQKRVDAEGLDNNAKLDAHRPWLTDREALRRSRYRDEIELGAVCTERMITSIEFAEEYASLPDTFVSVLLPSGKILNHLQVCDFHCVFDYVFKSPRDC